MASLPFSQVTPFLEVKLFGFEVAVFSLCMVTGFLVDVDHIVDFLVNRKLFYESLEERYRKGRMFVVFHGVENAIILIGLASLFPFLVFPATSYVCHMIMDIYGNKVPHRAYSYTVRFGKKVLDNTRPKA